MAAVHSSGSAPGATRTTRLVTRAMRATLGMAAGVGALVAAQASALVAQGTRDSLPPRQKWGAAAPAPSSTRPPAAEPTHPKRPHHRPDRGDGWYDAYGRYGSYGGYRDLRHAGAWPRGVGLQAQLLAPQGQRLHFGLGDVAYVAVFEIQPGRGVRVVFPDATAPERPLAAGWHERALPGVDPLATRGGPYSAGPWRYFYLVASETPLELAPARRTVTALEALIGPLTFQTAATSEVTSAIRQRVVRLGTAGTWTDALLAWQPGAAAPSSASVRCPNGATYTVLPGQGAFECPR